MFCDDIWPGAIVLSNFLAEDPSILKGKYVLELGAGASLPSIVSLRLGAARVVITDYPGKNVLENIESVLSLNNTLASDQSAIVIGHIWGENCDEILSYSSSHDTGFDVILLAELLWKDTYHLHRDLIKSCWSLLSTAGIAYVSFAHRSNIDHPPEKDLEFFSVAEKEFGFVVDKISTCFTRDVGGMDELIEVHLYSMKKRE